MPVNSTVPIEFTKDPGYEKIREYLNFNEVSDYAKDFGGMIVKRPLAVFTPPTVEILQQFLKMANDYGVKVTCRGKGNSAYGQAQVEGGVIINLEKINIPLEFNSKDYSSISIPAFEPWSKAIDFAKQQNKTILITIDHLQLTVGGTLSFGALGGPSYLHGSGADQVLSLEVITIDGNYYRCSETENRDLFHAALCGMGQFCIILSATIPLVTAKKQVNVHFLSYDNAAQFLREQKILYNAKIFDHLKGFVRKENGTWQYVIEAAAYHDDHEDRRVAAILAKLSATQHTIQTMPYWNFINMVTEFMKLLQDQGKLNVPHPWYTVLIPEQAIESHLEKVLDTPHLTGNEPVIVYPLPSDRFQRPLFVKPDCETFYLLGVLYNTSLDATKEFPCQEVVKRNKKLYLGAKQEGGCRYPIDAISFTPKDWEDHYGEKWDRVCRLKEQYDPKHLLSTGINMFDKNSNKELLEKATILASGLTIACSAVGGGYAFYRKKSSADYSCRTARSTGLAGYTNKQSASYGKTPGGFFGFNARPFASARGRTLFGPRRMLSSLVTPLVSVLKVFKK